MIKMHKTSLSSDYQVAIPEKLCHQLALGAGQSFTLIAKGNILILVPTPELAAMRGIMKGANGDNYRDYQDDE
jgi:bifunctional DNA-binding transcriptional regulator/antitoxin component of YhaV-PrlF toxin-antitoxin module